MRRLKTLAGQLVVETAALSSSSKLAAASEELRLLHASDLHLYRYRDEETVIPKMRYLLQKAEALAVDVLLLAGDIFEMNDVPQELVGAVIDLLGTLSVPVVLLSGNHDGEIWARECQAGRLPGNLVLLADTQGETRHLEALDLTLWGKSTKDHTPEFAPLGGLPDRSSLPRPSTKWFVALAHGLYAEGIKEHPTAFKGRSSLITPEEVAASTTDYIALGHVHQFRDCSCGGQVAFYAGPATSAAGHDPSAALVTLRAAETAVVEFVNMAEEEAEDDASKK